MKSEQERPKASIAYEKPAAIDMGPTAPVLGASCAPGDIFGPEGMCESVGNFAGWVCDIGNDAGQGCDLGNRAELFCETGSDGDA